MPLPSHITTEIGRKRAREHLLANRDTRRALAFTALLCLVWTALGLALVLYSFHVQEPTMGRLAFWGGLGVGNGGVVFTILEAYRRGEKRGDW
jgi:hypothetical protein